MIVFVRSISGRDRGREKGRDPWRGTRNARGPAPMKSPKSHATVPDHAANGPGREKGKGWLQVLSLKIFYFSK